MDAYNFLTFHRDEARHHFFSNRESRDPFFDPRIKTWIVTNPSDCRKFIGSEKLQPATYAEDYRALSERFNIDFSALVFAFSHIPLCLHGDRHARSRRMAGEFLATRRNLLAAQIPEITARHFSAFKHEGRLEVIPDHSAFSRARNERFREGDVFRRVFERVVEACIAAGLVGGEGFAVDASLIQADANKQRSIAGQDWRKDRDPETASRAVKEYMATLDDTAWGAATDVVPKFVSPSDPAAQWTGAHKGPAFFAYSDNYLIDVKFGVIVDVEASRAIRQAEVGAARTMIERTEERFGLKPERLVADTAYGAAPMLNWLVEEKGIAPHIPVIDKSKREDGTFSRSDFRYDPTSDVYHCPGGKQLGTSGTVHEGKTLLYRASKLDCDVCPLKPRCCPKEPSRKIPRDIHEHARDVARSFAGTEGFERSQHERKKIEMRFAHLKRILRLGRLRLRGPRGAQDEFTLAAIAQNLRRLAMLVARPPPNAVQCIA